MKNGNIISLVHHYADTLAYAAQSKQQACAWVQWLMKKATSKDLGQLMAHDSTLSPEQNKQVKQWIGQIVHQHKPIEYILETISFAELELHIEPPVLIPRLETEFWVMYLAELFQKKGPIPQMILDVGTGSGCIALTLAHTLQAQVIATDISKSALQLAQKNAAYNNITTVSFVQSDLYASVDLQLQFDCIVSNPPYIPTGKHFTLPPSVTQWEDSRALFSGTAGLDHITTIIEHAAKFLHCSCYYTVTPAAQLCIEIDSTHAQAVTELLQNQFYSIRQITDQFSRTRAILATKKCIH